MISFMRHCGVFFCFFLGLGSALQGCTPAGVAVGGAAVIGTTIIQERSTDEAARDALIKVEINEKLLQYNIDVFGEVSISVMEGRVLLTGIVPTEEARAEAVKIAWTDTRVRDVINELVVGVKDGQWGRDTSIQTKLRARLLADGMIDDINYNIEVAGGTVYFLGIAQNQAEIDRVVSYARDMNGVRRVVSHVLTKDDPRRLKQQ